MIVEDDHRASKENQEGNAQDQRLKLEANI